LHRAVEDRRRRRAHLFKWLFGRKKKDAVIADTDLPPSDPTPPTDSQA
jgi:hypothetical protein